MNDNRFIKPIEFEFHSKETVDTMESAIFTDLHKRSLGKMKMSEIAPFLDHVATLNGLAITLTPKGIFADLGDFNKASELLNEAVLLN